MEKLRIAICDDDADTIDLIASSVSTVFGRHGVAVESSIFLSAPLLRRQMETACFDLIFLDIQMPKESGIAFAQWLREQNNPTEIVYVSSREDKVFDALTTEPFGFVRKNVFLEDISAVIKRYLKKHQDNTKRQPSLVLQQKNGLLRLSAADILYLEGSKKDQIIHKATGETITVHSTMEQLTEQLGEFGFLRIHKGFLVNCRYISAMQTNTVVLTNGETLPLSRKNGQQIKAQYLAMIREQGTLLL